MKVKAQPVMIRNEFLHQNSIAGTMIAAVDRANILERKVERKELAIKLSNLPSEDEG